SDEQARDYSRRYPERFIPFIGGQRDDLGPKSRRWYDLAALDPLLVEMKGKLRSGEFFGLGEFILVHHAYEIANTTETGGEVKIPVDCRGLEAIAKLAARYGVPVLFHAEGEPQVVREAIRLFESAPDTQFIWAHNCGRSSAGQIARLLTRYPKLACDLGHMFNGPNTQGGYGRYWPRKTPWINLVQDDDGRILPEMKELFETFPDRFMIGTDVAHTPMLRHYEYRIAMFRVLLAQLSLPTARKIAYENADRLFSKTRGGFK
ncbi:MAG TPA: amidohydrolase family protein, partial [Candidatus Acidoferrum sp.]|nr:amidohydrolase family protein [Candidatus Acidoferrum sp.]